MPPRVLAEYHREMWLTILVLLILALAGRAFGQAKPAYEQILDASDAAVEDTKAQEQLLAKIDAEIVKVPKEPLNHYVRGKILSRLGRSADAVAAYDAAFELDNTFGEAQYNAGVVLARAGQQVEAVKRFDLALKLDPKAINAAYNAGQAYYNLRDYEKSLARFQIAYRLAPNDFAAAKKVMQAQMALGKAEDAWKTRDTVFALWKSSKDEAVQRLTEYVLDQFDVGKLHVMVYETFAPTGDLYYVYAFKAYDGGKLVGSVQLESHAVMREAGTPYIFRVSKGTQHWMTSMSWKELPAYKDVKKHAAQLIASELVPLVGVLETTLNLRPGLLQRIETKNGVFELAKVEKLPDTNLGTAYTYRTPNSKIIDVFEFPIAEQQHAKELSPLDQGVSDLLRALAELKSRGAYESAYPEVSREIYYQIAEQRVSGRKVTLKFRHKADQADLRSLFLLFHVKKNFVKFRYTVPINQFSEYDVDDFVRTWLAIALDAEIPSLPSVDPSSVTHKQKLSSGALSREDQEEISRDLNNLRGRILGGFNPATGVITFDPALIIAGVPSSAILMHELSHAAYRSEEELDREIARITSHFGISLQVEDYKAWGKSELAADLITLAFLTEMGSDTAIRRYAAIRGIRHEVIEAFLKKLLE